MMCLWINLALIVFITLRNKSPFILEFLKERIIVWSSLAIQLILWRFTNIFRYSGLSSIRSWKQLLRALGFIWFMISKACLWHITFCVFDNFKWAVIFRPSTSRWNSTSFCVYIVFLLFRKFVMVKYLTDIHSCVNWHRCPYVELWLHNLLTISSMFSKFLKFLNRMSCSINNHISCCCYRRWVSMFLSVSCLIYHAAFQLLHFLRTKLFV